MSHPSPAGSEEFLPDPAVVAHPLGDVCDIGAQPLAELSEGVHIGQFHGEEAVRSVFHELGAGAVGENRRRTQPGI
jgi:hypothetical protein